MNERLLKKEKRKEEKPAEKLWLVRGERPSRTAILRAYMVMLGKSPHIVAERREEKKVA
jgi:hypothetical protein